MWTPGVRKEEIGPFAAGAWLLALLGWVWWARLSYPFDLEWMEGGMLAHAWRLDRGLQLYVPPNPDFIPYVYPPGYPALVALLGKVFGLSMTLGRAVSVGAILAAAATIGWSVLRAGGGRAIAWASALMFLGTYPMAGAFYDIVRADSLGVALLGGSIVLAREERPVASGWLLAASFLVKQNAAAFGVPIAFALALHDPRAALRFVVASAGPALAAIGLLQWWSGGEFLVWMRDVPASHPMAWTRAWADVPREWGRALPFAFGAVGVGLVIAAMRGQRLVPGWATAALSVWAGMAAVFYGLRETSPDPLARPFVEAFGYWGSGAAPAAAGILALGAGWAALANAVRRDRLPLAAVIPPWQLVLEVGLLIVAGGTALLMRVHESGFVNVHAPLFWILSWACGMLLSRGWAPLGRATDALPLPALASAGLTLQLGWAATQIDREALVPTAADVAAGWQFVDAIRAVDGPVLSPFAAWLPVYAGKPPSLSAMGVWDCNFADGPYVDRLHVIDDALRDHYWGMIIGSNQPMLGEFVRYYDPVREVVPERSPALNPKTGYVVRPWRLLAPKPPQGGSAP